MTATMIETATSRVSTHRDKRFSQEHHVLLNTHPSSSSHLAVSLTASATRLLAVVALIALCVPTLALPSGPAAEPGSMTPEIVSEAERRFFEMGYWTGAVDERFDEQTRWAMLAFQRITGRPQTGRLDKAEFDALQAAARPAPRETGYSHIEIDLARQVLLVVDSSGTVKMVLPISSGNGKYYTSEGRTHRAVTPRGRFKVYRKILGWRKSPLGLIYYPSYFKEGVAIHGSSEVPNYPASHGCIRIPMTAAKLLNEMTPVGTIVLVYDRKSGEIS